MTNGKMPSKGNVHNDSNMSKRIDRIPGVLYKLMIGIFALILIAAAILGNYKEPLLLLCAAVPVIAFLLFFRKFPKIFDRYSDLRLLIILSVLCFAVKFLWIFFMRMVPQVDYEMFYLTAVRLSRAWLNPEVNPDNYIALFPHIFGYSVFLSYFYEIFGVSVFLPTVLNVILTVVSGILIYKISRSMISTTAAVCAYVLWIICPSQTIYNSLVLSEPLYTALILAFAYMIVIIAKKETSLNWLKMTLYGAMAAVILHGINVTRPIAMILIIAMIIWVFILRFKEVLNKEYILKWLAFFAVMLTLYSAFSGLWDLYFTARIGEAPASTPGYNIHVGFNESSGGAWNAEDSGLLSWYNSQEGATADSAQKKMLEEAKKRITSGTIDFPRLFARKLNIFLGEDSVCVYYCQDIIPHQKFMRNICDLFYYFILLLSIWGSYKMSKTSPRSAVFFLPLYVIGLTCAQMLVEVAPRYHYSIIPFLIMILQFGLFRCRVYTPEKKEVKE